MSEYRDISGNVYKVIQRGPTNESVEDREINKDYILESLFNIFTPAKAKVTAGAKAS